LIGLIDRLKRLFENVGMILIPLIIVFSFFIKEFSQNTAVSIDALPIYSVDRQDKVVSVTFDINWAEKDYIYGILEVLDKYNVKGTFFIIGSWVNYSDDNLKKLQLISGRGHEIGNHSYKHPAFSSIGAEKIKDELVKTNEVLEKVTNEKIKLFRFPSGDFNKASYEAVINQGFIPIQWDVDSVDWKELGEEIEYQRVIKGVKPGSIILFHNNAKYTPKNLDRLLKELKEEGYQFETVGNLIYNDNWYVDSEGKQRKK
jgi:polysaccharide deacetylase family sporulation protein PdaB